MILQLNLMQYMIYWEMKKTTFMVQKPIFRCKIATCAYFAAKLHPTVQKQSPDYMIIFEVTAGGEVGI